jgi:small subunit ribosomal protein S4e
LANNRKEVKYVLHMNQVLVDGKRVKEEKFPVGLLDIVSVEDKNYIILVDNNARLMPKEIDAKKAGTKLCKLVGKTMLKGGKLQLNLYDGKNILVNSKDSKKYTVGGAIVLNLKDQKIVDFIELAKDKVALVAKGRHAGKIGKIMDITKSGLNLRSLTTIDSEGEKLMTNTDYIFIVGDKQSLV